MKKRLYMAMLGLASLSLLSGCSKKMYDEPISTKEQTNYEALATELATGLNVRYTLDNTKAQEVSTMFTSSDEFLEEYNKWKSKNNTSTSDKLYIGEYIQVAEEYYNEAKEFGMKHGLLYTNGKHTGLQGSTEEITPLVEGEVIESAETEEIVESTVEETSTEGTEAVVESESSVEETSEVVESTEVQSEDEMTDEEYKAYLDELFGREPEYILDDRTKIESELAGLEDKESLKQYFKSHYKNVLEGDYGENEPSEEELLMNAILYTGYNEAHDGIIDETIWESYTIEEAKEHIINTLLYNYKLYNDVLRQEYELMNTDEYKQQFIDSRKTAKEDFEKLKEKYGIVDETESTSESETVAIDPYNRWVAEYNDILDYIETHNFEEAEFSEVIEKDENGYYIPWQKIYDLALSDGKLGESLEFIAYGEVVKVDMPKAPFDYYTDKSIKLVSWDISEDTKGIKELSVELDMPDKVDTVGFRVKLSKDDKIIYNSDITSKIFD